MAVTSSLLLVHGAALMSQAMVFSVAMNSKKNALIALLVAANFTEIKGAPGGAAPGVGGRRSCGLPYVFIA